jgi:hypothetical protein
LYPYCIGRATILEVLADLNVRLRQIYELLREEFGGEGLEGDS